MTRFRNYITLLFLVLNVLIVGAVPADEALKTFLNQTGVPSGSLAVKIIDLSNGKVLATHNEEASLIPASIMKSVTTAALLDHIGPDWCYNTKVYIDGPVNFGFLRGNIIVEGACDPTLNSEKQPFSEDIVGEICEALKSQGIRQIEGGIIIDESNFKGVSQPDTWGTGDKKKYYGAGSHALNFADNSKGDFAVLQPSTTFINQLKRQLEVYNIEMLDKPIPEGLRTEIFSHVSAPIDEIMRSCMMRSDNMFAESMLRTYGKLQGSDGSTAQAAEKETELWRVKKLPLNGVKIVDGSGLSRANKVTAKFMSELLKKMSGNPHYASFFPLAGQEGTLRKFLAGTELDSYIAMKTGSMTGIQCYAGYKLDDDYMPTHVIVIIMNEIPKTRDRAVKAAEKLLLDIFVNES